MEQKRHEAESTRSYEACLNEVETDPVLKNFATDSQPVCGDDQCAFALFGAFASQRRLGCDLKWKVTSLLSENFDMAFFTAGLCALKWLFLVLMGPADGAHIQQ